MKKKFDTRDIIGLIAVVLCIATVMIASAKLGNTRYYIPSSIVLVLALIAFLASFRQRKPKAMEFIVLFVLCVISIAFRAIFTAFPAFKPSTGVIVITGMAFGPQAGFLTGAASMLLSNAFFGQGPWTPWQMVAIGLAGYISGILVNCGVLKKDGNRIVIALWGYLLVQLIVGPFLDTCSMFLTWDMPTNTGLLDLLKSGIPYNAVHAAATALLLLLLYGPIMDKLDRIKTKYCLMEEDEMYEI